jgi:hypothetical protein
MIFRHDLNPEIIQDIVSGKIPKEDVDPILLDIIMKYSSLSSKEIKEIFFEIIRDSKKLKKNEMEKKYDDFNVIHGRLYSVALDSVMSNKVQETIAMLDYMLTQRDKIENGSMTLLNAGLVVGNKLGHKYVYPKTGVPTSDDYKKAINEIKEKSKENN